MAIFNDYDSTFGITTDDGYPMYRRRKDGRSHQVRIRDEQNVYHDFHMTNEWVVPYSPYLSKKYNAHINVEICASVQVIKYINKYIYKGSDQTTLKTTTTTNQNDEVAKYLNGRYISPVEAAWRFFEFPMHEESPYVSPLAVHLENEQPVCFDPSWPQLRIDKVLRESRSTLMAYFQYNDANQNNANFQPLLYQQFPEFMTWHQNSKMWKPRGNGSMSIGRMYYCNPAAGERYYLRLLLTVVRGATSFSQLRTVNEQACATYREACMLLHLIEDDQEWTRAFEEAAVFASGYSLRSMFVSALLFNALVLPADIWQRFCQSFCDDLEHQIVQKGYSLLLAAHPGAKFYLNTRSLDYDLYLLQTSLASQDRFLRQFDLPLPLFNWNGLINRMTGIQRNSLILNEMSYLQDQEAYSYQQKYAQMNSTQKQVFDTIASSINNNVNNSHFFLQGPAGTGIAFVYNTLCHYYRSQGKIVLCVASSGIAALLLPGGRTSHSRFAIPLKIYE